MGLENLKSVFQEDLNNSVKKFSSNVITNVNDTKFTQFTTPPLNELIGESPIQGMSWESLYNPNHSPKDNPSHKELIPISYGVNVSRDNLNIRNPNDGRFGFGGSTRTSAISAVGKLLGEIPSFDANISEFLKDTGKEPYIVSPIPKTQSDLFSGRTINFGSRDLPIARSITDTVRLAKYLTSPSGLLFIAKQNALGLQGQKYKSGYNPISTLMSSLGRAGGGTIGLVDRTEPGLGGLLPFLDVEYPNFNPLAEPIAGAIPAGSPLGREVLDFSGRVVGFQPNFENYIEPKFGLYRDEFENPNESFGETSVGTSETPLARLNDSFTGNGTVVEGKTYPEDVGDKHTLLDFGVSDTELTEKLGRTQYKDKIENAHPNSSTDGTIEGSENGMPFYFKDMRDGAFVFFRAYLEAISENVSPSYNSTQYIGRSEPVYTYSQSERELSMTLKLFAQTKDELNMIYKKMDRLTSLCYPEYFQDIDSDSDGNLVNYGNRMKPPLTKFRLGEMYGNSQNRGLMGYIKSLSYSVEQSSPWETEVGKRVPKHVIATIGYQIIHGEAPSLETKFYGINYE